MESKAHTTSYPSAKVCIETKDNKRQSLRVLYIYNVFSVSTKAYRPWPKHAHSKSKFNLRLERKLLEESIITCTSAPVGTCQVPNNLRQS